MKPPPSIVSRNQRDQDPWLQRYVFPRIKNPLSIDYALQRTVGRDEEDTYCTCRQIDEFQAPTSWLASPRHVSCDIWVPLMDAWRNPNSNFTSPSNGEFGQGGIKTRVILAPMIRAAACVSELSLQALSGYTGEEVLEFGGLDWI